MKSANQNWITKFIFLFAPLFSFGQDYAWVKGSNFVDQSGIYGTLNVPSSNNNPGARLAAMGWKDKSGNLWLFGGNGRGSVGNVGFLNDLWKYNVLSNEWTWIRGNNSTDQIGTYGTKGISSPGNEPGGRWGGSTWMDTLGNLFLFGGFGLSSNSNNIGELNDLWKYNIAANEWTWITGSDFVADLGTYGIQGISSSSNCPSARLHASSWTDLVGNFWLFGGIRATAGSLQGSLNDLWKYDIILGQWTWIKGTNSANQAGIYNTIAVASPSNCPGGRSMAANFRDVFGNLYLFGGTGYGSTNSSAGILNDLWKYELLTNQWKWINGSNTVNQNGNYGTKAIPSGNNQPGSRFGSNVWIDDSDNIFLFGGYGSIALQTGLLNDLWKYTVSNNQWVWLKGDIYLHQPGVYGNQGFNSALNNPGARQRAVSWTDNNSNLWLFGGSGVSTNSIVGGSLNDLWRYSCTSNPTVLIASNSPTICAGESASLNANGALSYSWSSSPASTNSIIIVSPAISTIYTVTGFDIYGCRNSSSITQVVDLCTGIESKSKSEQDYFLYPNPNRGEINTKYIKTEDVVNLIVQNIMGDKVISKVLRNAESINVELPSGVYLYNFVIDNHVVKSGKFIVEK